MEDVICCESRDGLKDSIWIQEFIVVALELDSIPCMRHVIADLFCQGFLESFACPRRYGNVCSNTGPVDASSNRMDLAPLHTPAPALLEIVLLTPRVVVAASRKPGVAKAKGPTRI